MYNLTTVLKFEITRQLKKPNFWLSILALPVIMTTFGLISFVSTNTALKQQKTNLTATESLMQHINIVDQSGLVEKHKTSDSRLHFFNDPEQALTNFHTNPQIDAVIIYPENIQKHNIKVYTKTQDKREKNSHVSDSATVIAKSILQQAITQDIDPQVITNIKTSDNLHTTPIILDENGEKYSPMSKMIIPGICLAIFFFLTMLSTHQTIMTTTEEKENRISEMLLTTITAKTLIIGKIVSSIVLSLIQGAVLIISTLLILKSAEIWFRDYQILQPITNIFSNIEFEFWPTFFGISFLIIGFLLINSCVILLGSMFQTAQEAAKALSPIMICIILPIYCINAILSGVHNPLISLLSFFPLTSPLTMLARNLAGNLEVMEGLISLGIMLITTIIIMNLAVQIFKRSLFEYHKTFTLKEILGKK